LFGRHVLKCPQNRAADGDGARRGRGLTGDITYRNRGDRGLREAEIEEPRPRSGEHDVRYAATPDGQRFLVNTVIDQPTRPALTVILNWAAELEK
jgi:hypothetical protein